VTAPHLSAAEREEAGRPIMHELKVWPVYLDAILNGEKPFEIRRHDRDFRVGDVLRLREYDPEEGGYGKRQSWQTVTYVMPGGRWGVSPDYCVMGLRMASIEECFTARPATERGEDGR
jgi:hypothetical protein